MATKLRGIPPAEVRLVDPNTGRMNGTWRDYFLELDRLVRTLQKADGISFDPTGLNNTTSTTVQQAIADLDDALGS